MSEGERKYTGFAAIYKLEQEKLKSDNTQPAPDAQPQGEASVEPSGTDVPEEISSANSNIAKGLTFVKMRELATIIITINKSRVSRDFFYQPACAISI